MVNGMGGTPLIELYLMYGEVAKIMDKRASRWLATCRELHHLAGNGRLLGHRAAGKRGVDQALGCSR